MNFDKDQNSPVLDTIGADDDDWLLTYSDLFTLLFAFFVLIVAISQIDEVKFQRVAQSMEQSVGKQKLQEVKVYSLQEIYANLEKIVKEEGLTDQAEVNYSPVGIVMRFKGNVLFSSASAIISTSANTVLEKISQEIIKMPYKIAVEGHTDNRPISTSQFPSNWELSAGRAASVVRFFIGQGVQPYKVRAVGRADTKPLLPNMDENGNGIPENQALNRRVEIVFLATSND